MTVCGTVPNRSAENARRLRCDLVDALSHSGTLPAGIVTDPSCGPAVDQLIRLSAGHLLTYQLEVNI
jgi:hypothetical protein